MNSNCCCDEGPRLWFIRNSAILGKCYLCSICSRFRSDLFVFSPGEQVLGMHEKLFHRLVSSLKLNQFCIFSLIQFFCFKPSCCYTQSIPAYSKVESRWHVLWSWRMKKKWFRVIFLLRLLRVRAESSGPFHLNTKAGNIIISPFFRAKTRKTGRTPWRCGVLWILNFSYSVDRLHLL